MVKMQVGDPMDSDVLKEAITSIQKTNKGDNIPFSIVVLSDREWLLQGNKIVHILAY